MTIPPTYNKQFTVPPKPGSTSFVTEDMLPPIPPRPQALTAGLYWMGAAALVYLISGVWQMVVTFAAMDAVTRPEVPLSKVVFPILACTAVSVVVRFIRRGSRVALQLTIAGAALAMLRPLAMLAWLGLGLMRDHSPQPVVDRFLDSPGSIGASAAGLLAVPALFAFTRRCGLRWSRKAEAIRTVRRLIGRGVPVNRLPPAVYD